MRQALALVLALALAPGCATGDAAFVPTTATTDARNAYAGKTLECAGEARARAMWTGLAGVIVGAGGGVASSLSASTSRTSPALSTALGITGAGLSLAGLSLDVAAFAAVLQSADLDERAGRVLAGEANDACVDGAVPK